MWRATRRAPPVTPAALFFYNGVAWELTGIMGAIANLENQSDSTAVIGNAAFSASIASYNSFITQAIPEPAAAALFLGLGGAGSGGLPGRRI